MSVSKGLPQRRTGTAQAASAPNPLRAMTVLTRGSIWTGFGIIALFFLGFGTWAALAPLKSAAIASGKVIPEGLRRTVQHFEGGIIGKLLVKNGDQVDAGQPLVVLERTVADSANEALRKQIYGELAIEARLIAEMTGADSPSFPDELKKNAHVREAKEAMIAQRNLFRAGLDSFNKEIAILEARVHQIREEIGGLRAKLKAMTSQMTLLSELVRDQQELYDKKLVRKSVLIGLKSRRAAIEGGIGETTAQIARSQQSIGEAELRIKSARINRLRGANKQLVAVRSTLASLRERQRTTADRLRRTVIRAPTAGKVLNLRFSTIGGVVRAGEAILDLVPTKEKLVVEARLTPADIDGVSPGQRVRVIFPAFDNRRNQPRINGFVRTIAADAVTDPGSKAPYYGVRIEVPVDEIGKLPKDDRIVIGMPVEVFIERGDRTLLDYLFDPIIDAMRRSGREG